MLCLPSPEDPQPGRVVEQPADEVEADAVGLAGADDVAEPEARAVKSNIAAYADSIASPASLLAPYVEIGTIGPWSSAASSSPRSP